MLRTNLFAVLLICFTAGAQQPTTQPASAPTTRPVKTQAQLDAEFAAMLSGATLEGSFTSTAGGDGKLTKDKYTLGEVRKLAGNTWLFPARIQYGEKDISVPLPLSVEWAGDTPIIVVDNMTIPGMGTFSARVMFFADHYCGYWQHDDRGGHLFGEVRRAGR